MVATPDFSFLRQAESRYAGWLADNESIGVALCWTVSHKPADVSVMDLLSADWASEGVVDLLGLSEASFDDGGGREHVGWLLDTDTHIAVLELNGFGGSLQPGLQAWGRAVDSLSGMFWNVNLDNQVAIARDGRLSTAVLEPEPFTDEDSLITPYAPLVTSETDVRAFGLALVETETGLRLDDELLTRRWPLVRFSAREDDALGGGTSDDRLNAMLYASLVAASDARFREAKMLSAQFVANSTGIDGDLTVQEAIEWNRTGQELPHDSRLSQQLNDLCLRTHNELSKNWHRTRDVNDLTWRRMQAAGVVERMTRVQQRYEEGGHPYDVDVEGMQDVWQHVEWVAGESWPALRQQLINIVT